MRALMKAVSTPGFQLSPVAQAVMLRTHGLPLGPPPAAFVAGLRLLQKHESINAEDRTGQLVALRLAR